MATLLSAVQAVLTFVLTSLTTVVDAVVAEPVLFLGIALAVTALIVGWFRSMFHY
jgi:hypothetical protein